MKVFKRVLKILGILLAAILVVVVGFFAYLSITEFRPDPVQAEEINGHTSKLNQREFSVLSWNIGYCGLGKESDFFMDGGQEVRPASEALVQKNCDGILKTILDTDADFTLLQEVDSDSTRSYGLDQVAELRGKVVSSSAYAMNFCTRFVPYPWPPIGKVNSGLLTLAKHDITDASRISLPCPFSWPVSMVNLKRCLLVTRVPVEGSDRELVLVNLHLEAYDDGEGKLAQSRQLREFVEQEYAKGNYVIAGGDWNQIFPDSEKAYPNSHRELWTPGYLDSAELRDGWSYVWDDSVPTCRLLNQPYDPSDTRNTQYYVIDGFLISPNLHVEAVQTLDESFSCTDHNPVLLKLSME